MRLSLTLLAAALLSGCATRTPLYRPVTEVVASERQPLAIELRSGERVMLRNAYVRQDTLIGIGEGTGAERRVAAADIASITRTERELHPLAIGGLGVVPGMLVGVSLLVVLLFIGS